MFSYLKREIFPKCIASLVKYLVRYMLSTCKVEVLHLDNFLEAAKDSSCILSLWHNRLLITPELLRMTAPQFTYAAVVSNSKDGEFLAKMVNSYPQGKSIRVAHNARHKALIQVIKELEKGKEVIVFTPDGPRGPLYQVKPGIIMAAKESGAKIVPVTWSCTHYWELNTWDKMRVPKPFSKIVFSFGLPHEINGATDTSTQASEFKEKCLQLDLALEQN